MSRGRPIHGFGGGAALNFKVTAYATEDTLLAAAPKENTIGIVTTTKITSYTFSASEPTEPEEGVVWVIADPLLKSCITAFPATKKNPIMLYPISCKQWIGSAWQTLTAYVYKGRWIQFSPHFVLYDGSVTGEDISMWAATGGVLDYSSEYGSVNLRSGEGGTDRIAYITERIDLSRFSTLSFETFAWMSGSYVPVVGVKSSATSASWSASATMQAEPTGQEEEPVDFKTYSVDVSAFASGYIAFSNKGANYPTRCRKVYLSV